MGRWLSLGIVFFWVVFHPWQLRERNRPQENAPRYPNLGLANALTIGRGLLLPWMAFWAIGGLPLDSWLGGAAYLLFILLDFCDGLTARLTRRPSLLGADLDMHYDGWGVFLAAALLVRLGKAPAWYVLVGLARPLYLLALALLERSGRTPRPLPNSPLRRTLAGLQMAYLALALLPIFAPSATRWFAHLFFLPFMLQFAADFFRQAGWPWPTTPPPEHLRPLWSAFRLLAGLGALWLAEAPLDDWSIGGWLLLLGVLPRLTATSLLLRVALALSAAWEPALAWLSLSLAVVLHFGGGHWALWAPEEALFTRYLGGQGD